MTQQQPAFFSNRPDRLSGRGRRHARWGAACLVAVLLLTSAGPSAATLAATPSAPGQSLSPAETQRAYARAQTAKALADQLAQDLLDLDLRLEKADADYQSVQQQEDLTRSQIRAVQGQIDALVPVLARDRRRADQALRFIYEHGLLSYLDVLLGSSDFADFVSRFELIKVVVDYQVSVLKKVRNEDAQLRDRQGQLTAAEARLKAQEAQLAGVVARIRQLKSDKEQTLAVVRVRAGAYEATLLALEKAWVASLVPLRYFFGHLSDLPWDSITPDSVDVQRTTVRATISGRTLTQTVSGWAPELAGIHFEVNGDGLLLTGGEQAPFALELGLVVADAHSLQLVVKSLTVADVPVGPSIRDEFTHDRDLTIHLASPLPGLSLKNVAPTAEGLQLTFGL